jgi:hypothetical protein
LAKFFKEIADAHQESPTECTFELSFEIVASGGPKVLGQGIAPTGISRGECGDLVHLPCVQFTDSFSAPPVIVDHDNGGGGGDGGSGSGDGNSDDVPGEPLPDEVPDDEEDEMDDED